MKNYESPVVLGNEELAEGVFAAASGAGCYTATANIHQVPQTGRGDYRIQVNGVHNADHTKETQWLTISFNQNVTYKSSNGTCKSVDGTPELVIEYHYHQNPTDNIGLGDLVVESDPGLEVSSVKITD